MQVAGHDVRFHLIGHSFGCIVASSILAGPHGRGYPVRPLDTLVLIQEALSLWSYCPQIPTAPGRPGDFHSIMAGGGDAEAGAPHRANGSAGKARSMSSAWKSSRSRSGPRLGSDRKISKVLSPPATVRCSAIIA
jgi:hypothetical protein